MNTHRHGGGGGRRRNIWKGPAFLTALLLSIPLGRGLFVSGWDWDVRVFLLVGGVATLLFSMGLAFQMVIRKLGTTVYRAAVGVALVTTFVLVWGNFVQAADDVTELIQNLGKTSPEAIAFISDMLKKQGLQGE